MFRFGSRFEVRGSTFRYIAVARIGVAPNARTPNARTPNEERNLNTNGEPRTRKREPSIYAFAMRFSN